MQDQVAPTPQPGSGGDGSLSARGISLKPDRGEHTSRRNMLKWLIRAGYGAFALAFIAPAVALRTLTQNVKHVAAGDTLVYATGDKGGAVLNANDVQQGTAVQAFPKDKTEDSNNLIQVVRVSADPAGVVAYSAICTHLGCSVLAQLTPEHLIICPCHGSEFDPAADAAIRRGPAARPLPSLPVRVEADGSIVATGGFSGKVGPD